MTSKKSEEERKSEEDQNRYQFSVKSENNSGQQTFGNHNKIENTSIQLNYSSYTQQHHNYNKFVVLNVLPNETSSDSDSKTHSNSKDYSRKKSKKRKRINDTINRVLTEDTWIKQTKEGTNQLSVFKQNHSTAAEEVDDKEKKAEIETFRQRFPQQQNLGNILVDSGQSGNSLRERKKSAKPTGTFSKSSRNQQAKRETFFSPVSTAIVQLFCYVLCFGIACYMEWPLWHFPYICYGVFTVIASINIASCIGCIEGKYIKSDNDTKADNSDFEAFARIDIGIKHHKLLIKLIGLFCAVSLAFLSSLMYECTQCDSKWMQTAILAIASTCPYFTFKKDMTMLKVDHRCNVIRESSNDKCIAIQRRPVAVFVFVMVLVILLLPRCKEPN